MPAPTTRHPAVAAEPALDADKPSAPVTATLLTGRFWAVGSVVFDRDRDQVSLVVDEATEARLREHGWENVLVDGQQYRKPRFHFSNDAPGTENQLVPVTNPISPDPNLTA